MKRSRLGADRQQKGDRLETATEELEHLRQEHGDDVDPEVA